MTPEQVYNIAIEAVKKLARARGASSTFSFDAIWMYASPEVPSEQRPAAAAKLRKANYIELTGATTRAETPERAGSPTSEYRLGAQFRPSVSPTTSVAPSVTVSAALRQIEAASARRGFMITPAQIANFYLALVSSPLVILAGTSGTGKSWLPRLFAELIGAAFVAIPVQPQWGDNADLFGYTSTLAPDRFREGPLTKVARMAAQDPQRPALVLLDEMNLAAVEHYFSDFLSVMETRRRVDGRVITDSLPLELPVVPGAGVDPYATLRGLALPANIRVIGTANLDETTRAFSPKVLDRAFSIEFGEVDLTAFAGPTPGPAAADPPLAILTQRLIDPKNPVAVTEVYAAASALFDCAAGMLEIVKDILEPAGLAFGYRSRDAICLYLWYWQRDELWDILPAAAAFDLCLLQKVLPKISGTGSGLSEALEKLYTWLQRDDAPSDATSADPAAGRDLCVKRPYLRSAEKVRRMRLRLENEGATMFWGT